MGVCSSGKILEVDVFGDFSNPAKKCCFWGDFSPKMAVSSANWHAFS